MKTESEMESIDKTILEAISIYVDEKIQKDLNVHGTYSASYAQHYGLYSELLDFTSDLDICAWFATDLQSNDNRGRICVLDVEKAKDNSFIADLSLHPFAARARHQKAYGVYTGLGYNFESDIVIENLGLSWWEFERNDISSQVQKMDYYKTSDDKFSGYIALAIDDCINCNGKISDSSAITLSNRISRTPIFSVTTDLHEINNEKFNEGETAMESGLSNCDWEIKSAGEMGVEINFEKEREYSYSKWSQLVTKEPNLTNYKIDRNFFALRVLNTKAMTNIEFV